MWLVRLTVTESLSQTNQASIVWLTCSLDVVKEFYRSTTFIIIKIARILNKQILKLSITTILCCICDPRTILGTKTTSIRDLPVDPVGLLDKISHTKSSRLEAKHKRGRRLVFDFGLGRILREPNVKGSFNVLRWFTSWLLS